MIKKTKKMLVPSDIPELLQPGKRILLPGKIMFKPYGTMIWEKTKKAIVTSDKFSKYIDIPVYLIEGEKALGIIRLKPAQEIGLEKFKELEKFHKISEKDRESWWPMEETFYYYEIEFISKFDPPKKIIKPEGSYSWLDSVVFKGIDIGDPSEFKNEDLLRGHKMVHGFWKKLEASDVDCIKYHILLRNEILKRKLKHKIVDSLDSRSKEIEEALAEKGYEISFDREKSVVKINEHAVVATNKTLPKKTKKNVDKDVTRWNVDLSEAFDIEEVESVPASFEYDMFSKFLGCEVKNIYQNSYSIPSPLLGTYLSGFKKILSEFELCDSRNFSYSGKEIPLVYEVIKLNSKESDDFLIKGTNFYKVDGENKLVVKIQPTMVGIEISLSSSNKERSWNKELLKKVQEWTKKNNYLRGEIFGLSGEFLKKTDDTYNDLILDEIILNCINKSVNQLNEKREKALGRGLMFVGKPGTGKTKTGKVLMSILKDVTFIWVSSRDFHKVGSNTALKLGFDLARDLAPSVLFMEDIDTWLIGRSIDLLKTEMDGLKENKGMITILTSNNPEEFPDALLDRPGRFHDVLDFSLPTKEMRKKMIIKWTKEKIEDDLIESIVGKTDGYSGAHIKELVDFAEMIKNDDKLGMGKSLLKSLEKLQKQKELIGRIKSKKIEDVENRKIKELKMIEKTKVELMDLRNDLISKYNNEIK